MKQRAPQIELPLPDEPFKLAVQPALDGDRISRENREAESDKASAEGCQATFHLNPQTTNQQDNNETP